MALVSMNNIFKSFDGVYVLNNVSAEFAAGEIHALMGANGAGKSTLMNILAGVKPKDLGEIYINGEKTEYSSISDAEKSGVVMIHQELELLPDFTVAQNIYIGREPVRHFCIDDAKMKADAVELFKKLSLDIDPEANIGDLSVGKRQMVEIAKALSKNAKVLILDEPTAALSSAETEELFKMMSELKSRGVCLIYISHRMDEIFRICDKITVMRDGKIVATRNTSDITRDELINLMVGHSVENKIKSSDNANKERDTVLNVKNLSSGKLFSNISFELKKGEVLGFSGLVGAGRTEVARAIVGIDGFDSGEILLKGRSVLIHSPAEAAKLGICYLSEDRRRDGLLSGHSVTDNTAVSSIGRYYKKGFIDDKTLEKDAKEINASIHTKYFSDKVAIEKLSGGNQQKVILSRWLMADSEIFILDEPTRGIDVGAKDEIYELVNKLVLEDKSVIVISSEASELRRMCDRILVMCEGRITKELLPGEADDATLLKYATERETE